jgi:hypothetical protein
LFDRPYDHWLGRGCTQYDVVGQGIAFLRKGICLLNNHNGEIIIEDCHHHIGRWLRHNVVKPSVCTADCMGNGDVHDSFGIGVLYRNDCDDSRAVRGATRDGDL